MVEGTRRIKRSATVTETFTAVNTENAESRRSRAGKAEKESRELVSVAALTGLDHVGAGIPARGPQPARFSPGGVVDRTADRSSAAPSSSAVKVIGNVKTRQKEVGFQVMVGAAHQLEPSLALGAVGAILAFACPAPTACFEIYAALKEGDTALAREKQERVKIPAQRVVAELGVPGVKYAMDLNGYYGGAVTPAVPATHRRPEGGN